ncbi:MAG: restriction endonuclease subunit S [Syntrophales bacterium]
MKVWPSLKIGNLCDVKNTFVQTGPFGSQLHESDYSEEGIPVIMPKDILQGKISTRSIARVSENHVLRLKRHRVLAGDIIYGRRGDIGRQAIITKREEGWLCGTGCLLIRMNKTKVGSLYIHYYLAQQGIVDYVESQAIGATMPNLNTKILQKIPVTLPPLSVQRKIAAVLSAYDDLIENNNRRIAILENMAEELYREWFVRLRFPGHEKVKIVKGVPEGWEAKHLGKVVELAYGKALKEEDRIEGRFPVIGSSGIVGYHNTALVKGPGIVVGRKGNVGKIIWSKKDFFPIDTVYFVRSELPFEYLFYLIQGMNFINNDSAVPGLNRGQAYSNEFYFPGNQLTELFANTVKSFFQKRDMHDKQQELLTASRDRLLTRLMSGKIDVEDLDIQFPPSMNSPVEAGSRAQKCS